MDKQIVYIVTEESRSFNGQIDMQNMGVFSSVKKAEKCRNHLSELNMSYIYSIDEYILDEY